MFRIREAFSVKLEIDHVIETSLVAMFAKGVLSEEIFLKGGQALRLKENLKNRFSADMDFSTPGQITNEEIYFNLMKEALAREFFANGLCLFDFKFVRKPKWRSADKPDFWSGWAVEFKLIEESKRNLPEAQRAREAIIPVGANSPKITIDISEHEYCGAIEKFKLKGSVINIYTRTLLLLEKVRAICQQHPDYPHKEPDQRSRDYYDVERLWNKVLTDGNEEEFLNDCAKHLREVFDAKEVNLDLLEKIFNPTFVELQKSGWTAVEQTVKGDLGKFDYYNESLYLVVSEIKARL